MIGRLKGLLLEKQPPQLVVDVGGVGYEVEAPMSTFYQLPNTGESIALFTHLVVREDAQLLYGFASREERELFRELIRVSGVGPKLALSVLSGISVQDFSGVVASGDAVQLSRIPGIGKKTAERLIVELRNRIEGLTSTLEAMGASGSHTADAHAALLALGYKSAEAQRLIRKAARPDLDTEGLIREALKLALKR